MNVYILKAASKQELILQLLVGTKFSIDLFIFQSNFIPFMTCMKYM